jgi:hypothetical protein
MFQKQQFRQNTEVTCYNSSRLENLCHITIAAVQRYCDMFIMSSSEFKTVSCFNGSSVDSEERMCHVSQIRLKQITVPSHPPSPNSPI